MNLAALLAMLGVWLWCFASVAAASPQGLHPVTGQLLFPVGMARPEIANMQVHASESQYLRRAPSAKFQIISHCSLRCCPLVRRAKRSGANAASEPIAGGMQRRFCCSCKAASSNAPLQRQMRPLRSNECQLDSTPWNHRVSATSSPPCASAPLSVSASAPFSYVLLTCLPHMLGSRTSEVILYSRTMQNQT